MKKRRMIAYVHKLNHALKSINYLRIFQKSFPFATDEATTYHLPGAKMTTMTQKRAGRLFILRMLKPLALSGMLIASILPLSASYAFQDFESRRIKMKVDPEYPELARRLNLRGIVRVQVVVAAGGSVLTVKELGGNPVLLDALVRAVKKWKYEPAEKDSVMEVKFDFSGT